MSKAKPKTHVDKTPNTSLSTAPEIPFLWDKTKETILIITKARENKLVCYTRQITEWLVTTPRFDKKYPFIVYVDAHLEQSKIFDYKSFKENNSELANRIKFWTPKLCQNNPGLFDLIITAMLFTSWLFQSKVPPIMPFHLGSLSFLTPFYYKSFREELDALFGSNRIDKTVRMRLSCTVYRFQESTSPSPQRRVRQNSITGELWTKNMSPHNSPSLVDKWSLLETAWMRQQLYSRLENIPPDREEFIEDHVRCYTTWPSETFEVLNEIVVDRGPSAYMSALELFGDERHLTTVQADGLCIATPTGSTAYSLSANGSLTHPDVRCILVTPICPHTLSFRPMMLPDSMSIRIVVPLSSRETAYCSFDGRNRVELKKGDHVKITASQYALPTICNINTSNDWFMSLQKCLQWNVRQRQKSFVVVESCEKDLANSSSLSEKDNLFACIQSRLKNNSTTAQNQDTEDDDNNENAAWDLLPWSEQELRRDKLKETP
ncbi:ATP-NAD kinase-like domain-containing protein [Phycomyces blakesleeanus]|uniref:ATP-NAD kinase-like domain-containing protein n=1 Tax=Phycomyces blakesleeanus TaxID=4837 RepID=A0ABR3AKN6_PHYBL